MPRIRMSLVVEVEVEYSCTPAALPGIDEDGRPNHKPEEESIEVDIIHLLDPRFPNNPWTLPYNVKEALLAQQAGAIEEMCYDDWKND